MIEYRRGDLLQADAEALSNTVDCVGIMGRGIALHFRKEFPENTGFIGRSVIGRSFSPAECWFMT